MASTDKELNIKLTFASQAAQGFATAAQRASKFRVAAQKAALAFNKVGLNVLKSNTKLGAAARGMVRVGLAAGKMGRAVRAAGRGFGGLGRLAGKLGGILRGGLMVGVTAAIGGVFALGSAFGAMRDAMEGSGGAGPALEDIQDQAGAAGSGLSSAADQGEAAAERIKGVFGAFGAVGAGFVQAQGKLAEETASVMDTAVDSAGAASAALDGATDSLGDATQATTRFGKATDRISGAFARAKRIILQAIARAITPALEKFADLLESPTFQKFVDLLAKDLAKAAKAVADWFVDKVIPAMLAFMEEVNAAGGIIEWFKGKWEELKRTALMILAIILAKLLEWSNSIRQKFQAAVDEILRAWDALGDGIEMAMQTAADFVSGVFDGAVASIKLAINSIIGAIETAINAAIRLLRPFIAMYNAVANAAGGTPISAIGTISLPRLQAGGIIDSPMAAIVGDAPSPEVVSPLDDLVGILQEAGIGGIHIGNITVPAGTTNPQAFGQDVGRGIIQVMRAQGLRIPV